MNDIIMPSVHAPFQLMNELIGLYAISYEAYAIGSHSNFVFLISCNQW
jgi:hypothetical protein